MTSQQTSVKEDPCNAILSTNNEANGQPINVHVDLWSLFLGMDKNRSTQSFIFQFITKVERFIWTV